MNAVGERSAAPSARPSAAREKIEIEIVGGPGRLSRESFRELWLFRDVLLALAKRQVKVKYKQAAVGIGWSVLQPVVGAALFALFLGRFVGVGSDGIPYFLFAFTGMVAWGYFTSAAGIGVESLVAGQVLLRKVYFPREVMPLSSVLSPLVDLVPALLTLLLAALFYGIHPDLTIVALPIPVLLLVITSAAIGLGLGAVNVYYRDVRYALPFLFQIGLFATPVVYPLSAVPERWRDVYAVGNPLAAGIDGMRRTLVGGAWPRPGITVAAFAWALVLLIGSYAFFKRLERDFSDRV